MQGATLSAAVVFCIMFLSPSLSWIIKDYFSLKWIRVSWEALASPGERTLSHISSSSCLLSLHPISFKSIGFLVFVEIGGVHIFW